jgi:3-deoxy-manno-octulosonate cytidylyltransferase (CMP-KDO synthetase)
MKVVAIVPARMDSSRFPGKPLAPLAGKPMVEHVYRRTEMCRAVDEVYVATCDVEIADAVRRFGGRAIMTSPAHERASDRIAEAAGGLDADIVVMVQGDEPMIRPEMVDLALGPLLQLPDVVCTNLMAPIRTVEDFVDRNTIKVVCNAQGDALYMSREPIPTRQRLAFESLRATKQVCVIPFRRDFLQTYARLAPTPLEQAESIDMLRAMEHGFKIRMVLCDVTSYAVDTPADRAKVDSLLRNDPLTAQYSEQPGLTGR